MKEIITTIKIDDNGNVIGTSTETKVIEEKKEDWPFVYSQHAVVFDSESPLHTKDPEFNYRVLRYQENYANDKLKAKGHVFLNEVYDMLGVPRTKAGQVLGWIYNEENPDSNNFVEFELYPCYLRKDCMIVDFLGCKNILDLI